MAMKPKPVPNREESPLAKERRWYLEHPKVVCSKKGGLGIAG